MHWYLLFDQRGFGGGFGGSFGGGFGGGFGGMATAKCALEKVEILEFCFFFGFYTFQWNTNYRNPFF